MGQETKKAVGKEHGEDTRFFIKIIAINFFDYK